MEKQALKNSPVVFDSEHHTYTLYGQQLQGITPIISWLFPKTYEGIPKSFLDAAAEYGTMIHQKCELFDDLGIADDDVTKQYQQLLNEAGLEPSDSEYLVSDEHHIASCIDKVFTDDSLGDIKTTSKVHEVNVTVQLSIYAWLYEMQTGRKANKIYLIWLPKPRYGQPMIKELKRIPADVCQYIVEVYIYGGEPTDALAALSQHIAIEPERKMVDGEVPDEWQGVLTELIAIKQQIDKLTEREKEIRTSIMKAMQAQGTDKWATDLIQVSRVAATERVTIDSKALQQAEPEVYERYKKTSKVAESIRYKLL